MKYLLIPRSSSGEPDKSGHSSMTEQTFTALMNYNEEMTRAGVLLAAEGLNPNARSLHVRFTGSKGKVVDGPFAETKELIGGYYVIDVKGPEEAAAWALRYPGGFGNDDIIEIRPLTSEGDLPREVLQRIAKAAPTWAAKFFPGAL